jgi:hypothetical protein
MNTRRAPKRRNPLAACLSNGAYKPKRVPSVLEKARRRAANPKHRHADGRVVGSDDRHGA